MIKRIFTALMFAAGVIMSVGSAHAQQIQHQAAPGGFTGSVSGKQTTEVMTGSQAYAIALPGGGGGGAVPQLPVASAIAPGLALMPGSTCVLAQTASGGLQFMTIGASAGFGSTTPYTECNIQYNMRMLYQLPRDAVVVVQDANGQNVRINAHVLAGYMAGQLTGVSAAIKAYTADRTAGLPPVPVAAPMPAQQGNTVAKTTTAQNDTPQGLVWKCYNPRDQSTCGYVAAGS